VKFTSLGCGAMRTVSAAVANRQFSHILREVRDGETVVVTSHGTPVATIVPADREASTRGRAKEALLARLRDQPAVDIGSWSREDLYEHS
jgi:prevent-host-death family protein